MKRIGISAGHGAGDSGAVYKNLSEAVLTQRIAKRAATILRAHGVGVVEVPDNLDLINTIRWLNSQPVNDLVIEVHINSGGGTGLEVWDYAGTGNASDRAAKHVLDAMVAETRLRSRGTKDELTNRHGRLGFVHDTRDVAILAECGFIDGDYNFLNSDAGIEALARGVARGCLSYVGLSWKPELLNSQPAKPKADPVKAVEESKAYVFGYQTHGTVTQRMAKVIEAFKRNGISK